MNIHAVYLDFGFVLGYPTPGIDRKYLYLDWHGIDTLLADPKIAPHLRPGIGRHELEAFFTRELYDVFQHHERTDLIDPQSNTILLSTLQQVFGCPITQSFVDHIIHHLDTMKYITIDPMAIEVVRILQRRYSLSLVSNMLLPGKLLVARLQKARIADAFRTVTVSSDVGFIKPHAQIFHRTLECDHLQAEHVVFVGDTYPQDIRGAQQVGMKTIWLNSRHENPELAREHPPDAEIRTIQELIDIRGAENVTQT